VPELSEYINNALDLSPGTSLNESAEWIKQNNPELSGELKNISAGAWAPGATAFSEERKQKLIKMLAKLISLFLCCSVFALSAEEATQNDAVKAYDNGQFQTARQWYTRILERDGSTPALLYNIGNCYYQEKEFGKALFCYEKANLLAPRDTEILRNLELTKRELGIMVPTRLSKPSDIPKYLRDQMTPHEWMLLAAIGLSVLLIAFGLRKFAAFRITLPIIILGSLLLITGIVMPVSQYYSLYAPDRAMILTGEVQLKTLPSASAPNLIGEKLKLSENVEIRERRNEWVRVKAGDTVGWIPAKDVGELNGGKFNVF
jgi:tetratricopeptide (TPR) repeat protein